MSKKENIITIILFSAFILLGGIAFWLIPDKAFSDNENRYLAELPTVELKKLTSGEFMEEWEDYVSDQFPGRDSYMLVGGKYKYFLGMKDINGVFIGEDGYLLSVMDKNGVDHEQVGKNIDYINSFLDKCSKSETVENTAFMLIPDGAIILKDKLPKGVDVLWEEKLLKDIRGAVNNAEIICPENSMSQMEEQLYYYTDHHWTGYGAYGAYKEYCKVLGITADEDIKLTTVSKEFYGSLYSKVLFAEKADAVVIDETKADINIIKDGNAGTLYDYEALNKKDKYLMFQGGNYGIVEIDGNGEGVLLIIKDSFANSFVPFLTDNYAKIIMLDMRYYMGNATMICSKEKVTDVLVLYSLSNFVSDENMIKLGL